MEHEVELHQLLYGNVDVVVVVVGGVVVVVVVVAGVVPCSVVRMVAE